MVGYRVDLFRAKQFRPYHSFTLGASGDEQAISEARTLAPIGQQDLERFTLVKMSGKSSNVIFDSSETKNA